MLVRQLMVNNLQVRLCTHNSQGSILKSDPGHGRADQLEKSMEPRRRRSSCPLSTPEHVPGLVNHGAPVRTNALAQRSSFPSCDLERRPSRSIGIACHSPGRLGLSWSIYCRWELSGRISDDVSGSCGRIWPHPLGWLPRILTYGVLAGQVFD